MTVFIKLTKGANEPKILKKKKIFNKAKTNTLVSDATHLILFECSVS